MQDFNQGFGYVSPDDIRKAIHSLQQQHHQLQASLMSQGSLLSSGSYQSAPYPSSTPSPYPQSTSHQTSSQNKSPPAVYRSPHQLILDTYFKENSVEFRALETAKMCGWESGNLDNIFNKFKTKATQNIRQKDTSEMRKIMQAVMCEVDKATGNIVSNENLVRFLDVCSGPGGFAEYILQFAPNSVGMGITLPVAKGGHPMGIPNTRRFWCHYIDIMENPNELKYCPPYPNPPYVPPVYGGEGPADIFQARHCKMQNNVCDLVILDGHYLSGTDRSNPNNAEETQSIGALSRSGETTNSLSGPLPPPPGFPAPNMHISESTPLPELGDITALLQQINYGEIASKSNTLTNSYSNLPGGGNLVPLQQSTRSELQLQLGAFGQLPSANNISDIGFSLVGSSLYDFPSGELPSIPSSILPAVQPQMLAQSVNGLQKLNQVGGNQRDPEEVSFEVSKTQNLLWVAQLIIAVQNLAEGGTLVMRSSTKPDFYLCILTCLMTKVFRGPVKPVKPTVSHMMRSSFYIVYKDFDCRAAKALQIQNRLLQMFKDLQVAQQGDSMWPKMQGLAEFADVKSFIESWGPSLLSFMSPLWRFQTLALTAMVHDQGSGRVMGMVDKTKMCFYHVLGQCRRIPEQCWYAHDVEQLTLLLREACKTRFMPLVASWSPLTLPPHMTRAIQQLSIEENRQKSQSTVGSVPEENQIYAIQSGNYLQYKASRTALKTNDKVVNVQNNLQWQQRNGPIAPSYNRFQTPNA